jgi:hypothetical protein
VNAIVCSTIAIWLVFRLARQNIWRKVAAALVMGVAICGMHYTGMYATVCVSTGDRGSSGGLDPCRSPRPSRAVTLLIMAIALSVSLQSQLLSRTLREQNRCCVTRWSSAAAPRKSSSTTATTCSRWSSSAPASFARRATPPSREAAPRASSWPR